MGLTSTLTNAATRAITSLVGSKAVIMVMGSTTEQIPVQFNPSQYSIVDRSSFSQQERNKDEEPVISYNGKGFSTLSVSLIFNSDEFFSISGTIKKAEEILTGSGKDITTTINKITALTRIGGDKHEPPGCVFVWGSLQFAGFVESVGVTYTMFDKTGKPLRATADLVMKGFNYAAGERNSPLQSPDRTKARTMTEDTDIWSMAEKEYGSSREWRRIADANDVMNPLDIPIGTILKVPSING